MEKDSLTGPNGSDVTEISSADVVELPVERSSKRPVIHQAQKTAVTAPKLPAQVSFDRRELSEILNVYGRRVAEGEWRDYAMDFQKDRAVFSIFKRSSEMPVYMIEKNPKLARKQGAYSVVTTAGMVLKRGHELKQVLKVLEPKKHLRVVD